MEDSGIGNELMEMQQVLWPVEGLRAQDFVIDMLLELKKTKWNPNTPVGGARREDLYHIN